MQFPQQNAIRIWPHEFEYHLNGQQFLPEALQKMEQEPRTPRTRSSGPAFNGPERPENLQSKYYDVTGWDDE